MIKTKNTPAVLRKEKKIISPWVSLVSKQIQFVPNSSPQTYHSLAVADYVSILAVVEERVPLVQQYRPALEQVTTELPGGLVDKGCNPELSARNELEEEVGLVVSGQLEMIGCFMPDSGRLENRLWGYVLRGKAILKVGWEEEPNMKRIWVTPQELKTMVQTEQFNHALHLAVILRAIINNQFTW